MFLRFRAGDFGFFWGEAHVVIVYHSFEGLIIIYLGNIHVVLSPD